MTTDTSLAVISGQMADAVAAVASAHGAPLCRATRVAMLPDHRDEIERILPGARSVVVLAAPPDYEIQSK